MLNNEMNKKFQAVKSTLNFILSDEYTEDLYNLFKNALLEDEEFIDKLRDKLGNECSCKHEEQQEENLEDVNEPSEQFIMTNSEGEALIDTDELQISSGEESESIEEETMQAVLDLFESFNKNYEEEVEEELEDEYDEKDADGDLDFDVKQFGFSEATQEDVEQGEVEVEEDLLEKLKEALENGELEGLDMDMDIDLGELAQQLKLLTQQQNSYKFMERDPQEYDKIIADTFGDFPLDLGGNDEF